MARHPSLNDSEPTPAFNDKCMDLIHSWESGDTPFEQALQTLECLAKEAETDGHLANMGRIAHLQGYLHHYGGNLNTSIMHNDRARQLFDRLGNRRRVATLDMNQGENYRYKGEFSRARMLYRSAYEAARDLNYIPLQSMALANEGLVLLSMQEDETAHAALTEALHLTGQWTDRLEAIPALRCEIHHGLATIYLRAKNIPAAWEEAQAALENANQTGQPMQVGYANRIFGDVVTMLLDDARSSIDINPDDHYRAARTAFEEINADVELARTLFAQAMSLTRRGKKRFAARALQHAINLFSKLGMSHDAARAAEAQLAIT